MLKDKNLVLESGSSQRRLVFDEEAEEKESEEVVEDVKEIVVVEEPVVRVKKRIILRTGSEGDEVQKLQVLFDFYYVNESSNVIILAS